MSSRYRPKKDDDRMSAPRPYDLSNTADALRLFFELQGYMRVSLKDGTDTEGRAHAYAALCELNTGSGLLRMRAALERNVLTEPHESGSKLVLR